MPAPYADPAGRVTAESTSTRPSPLSMGLPPVKVHDLQGDRRWRWLVRRQNLRATTRWDGWPDGRREGKDVRGDQASGEWCLVCMAMGRRKPESQGGAGLVETGLRLAWRLAWEAA